MYRTKSQRLLDYSNDIAYLCATFQPKTEEIMKKVIYLFATAALLAACSGNKGYTVTGTVEGAQDGDTIHLVMMDGRMPVSLATAIVKGGAFSLKGTQDTAQVRYLTLHAPDHCALAADFFLENGDIKADLREEGTAITGTPNNDAYQAIRNQTNELNKQMADIYEAMADTALTDEQRQVKAEEMSAMQDKVVDVMKEGIRKNIANAVGVHLLKQNYYYMDVNELDPLMPQIPAQYAQDEAIVRIKDNVEKMKATAVGQKFTDFEMQTPDGKPVKLSDYAGQGKVVLVDFWASWCGPCRREMPNLVDLYAKYKNKGFEIVGVSLDRDAESWQKGIKDLGITWPQMSDLKYWNCEGAKLYAVSSIPHTVLIGGDGTILARGLHGDELQEAVAGALK